jgi:elongation factor 1-gamma
VVAGVALMIPFQVVLDAGFRKAMPHVAAWMERFFKLPEVVKRMGNVKFCQKQIKAVFAEKKKEEMKQAPPKKAAKKDDDDDEDKPAKSEKNPIDALPPSKFVLPEFKTYFVNLADKRGEGMNHFFEKYDKEGYCIYFMHYDKYEGEGVELYKTQNMLSIFLQRIDNLRRYCFSMHGILGAEPNLEIMGVWLFRGKQIPAEMKEDP